MIPLTQILRGVQSIQTERMVVARGWSWRKRLLFNGWMGWEIFYKTKDSSKIFREEAEFETSIEFK